ncbi:glycosyl hydrolase family 76-domain-containing protein [Lasiosphaeria miniovina]|uniref:Mannan endo-1,6-alpha-mannosidase n=1 Tax=Lasiosphaeria miniovina TaxID=1954250 RepID=A0AA40DUD9_9PEZI|nr:glycosyl hydrolase family 76-domain-containing protein [Lasiosphaeria miniovina]KAK0713752.1 glycosyl hydrolase family 76-domain-containing protein [Lasiosphaeria miniovina]
MLILGRTATAASAQKSPYQTDSRDHILASSRTLAYDVMAFYKGNQTGQIPGLLPGPPVADMGPYWWWQGSSLMGTLIEYSQLTGDDTYNAQVTEGLLWQKGPYNNFMPTNWTASMGNDDQCFWGAAALRAAETGFPSPPQDQPQWVDMAKNVWENLASPARNDHICGGGLRWQISLVNNGYDYKNTASNACFFSLSARLARFTGNSTYADHASSTFEWLQKVGFIDNATWAVYDGATSDRNCTDVNKLQLSYSATLLVQGAAFMYNYTNGKSTTWFDRLTNLTAPLLSTFFPNGTAYEVACELRHGLCTSDMRSFKGLAHRWLASAAQVAPAVLTGSVLPVLESSAAAAAAQCTGGASGRACGFYWASGEFVAVDDAEMVGAGAGEQIDVLAAVQSLLVSASAAPFTAGGSGSGGSGSGSGGGTGTGTGTGTESGSGTGGSSSATSAAATTAPTSAAGRQEVAVGVLAGAALGLGWMSL